MIKRTPEEHKAYLDGMIAGLESIEKHGESMVAPLLHTMRMERERLEHDPAWT